MKFVSNIDISTLIWHVSKCSLGLRCVNLIYSNLVFPLSFYWLLFCPQAADSL